MGQQDLHLELKQQSDQLSPVPQDSRLHWPVWKPYVFSGYKDLVRSWSVTSLMLKERNVRSRVLLVAAGGQNLPHTEMDGQAGKWGEAGHTSYLEVQLRFKHSAHLDLKMILKLILSCWPSLRYLGPGPTAKGSSITLNRCSLSWYLPSAFIYKCSPSQSSPAHLSRLLSLLSEVLFIPLLPSLAVFTLLISSSSFWSRRGKTLRKDFSLKSYKYLVKYH